MRRSRTNRPKSALKICTLPVLWNAKAVLTALAFQLEHSSHIAVACFQYGGLLQGLRRGPVEEVSLEQFANGRALWIRYGRVARFDADEVVRRARSRIGEDRYRLLTNDCEHFCEADPSDPSLIKTEREVACSFGVPVKVVL